MHRYFVELSYNGHSFHGWQFQPNAESIQSALEKIFKVLFQTKVSIIGCGRTDTGVHARLYYAHFDLNNQIESIEHSIYKLNAMLPKGISIHTIFPVDKPCHARFDATLRTYQYHIHFHKDPFKTGFSWLVFPSPDFEAMNAAAELLLGEHDFAAFSKSNSDSKTSICYISEAKWERSEQTAIFTISANRFLRNMVRAIVGTLLEVGKGKITPDDFHKIILSLDRTLAGMSVPPHGLYLHDIQYPFIKKKLYAPTQ